MQNRQERDGVQSESESERRYVSHSQRARARGGEDDEDDEEEEKYDDDDGGRRGYSSLIHSYE